MTSAVSAAGLPGVLIYETNNIRPKKQVLRIKPKEKSIAVATTNAAKIGNKNATRLDTGSVSEIEEVFDVESVLTYVAGNVALGSWDIYPNTGHNYYLYEATPGRFMMLPWDMNGSLEAEGAEVCCIMNGLLTSKLMESPKNQARYFELLGEFLATAGSVEKVHTRVDAAESLLGSAISSEEIDLLRHDTARRVERLEEELNSPPSCE